MLESQVLCFFFKMLNQMFDDENSICTCMCITFNELLPFSGPLLGNKIGIMLA